MTDRNLFIGFMGAGLMVFLLMGLLSQYVAVAPEPKRSHIHASDVATAPTGTIVVNFDGAHRYRFKLLNPATDAGLRLIAWCQTGKTESRFYLQAAQAQGVEQLVRPDDGFYREALADCAEELGR